MNVTFVPSRPPHEARQLDEIYRALCRSDISDERRIDLTQQHRRLTTAKTEPTAHEIASDLIPAIDYRKK